MYENAEFIRRFIEACGTSKPAEIARLLSIPYQSAKNYLNGRIPTAGALVSISEVTSCSIDWLLTGRGKKFLEGAEPVSAPLPARQLEAIARRVVVEVINEMSVSQETAQPKIVRLQSSDIVSEKAKELVPKP
jgi:transcriptional regulator with XRE-family HTH domain